MNVTQSSLGRSKNKKIQRKMKLKKCFRGENFRTAYTKCKSVIACIECPILALTATGTEKLVSKLQDELGVASFKIIARPPDRFDIAKMSTLRIIILIYIF